MKIKRTIGVIHPFALIFIFIGMAAGIAFFQGCEKQTLDYDLDIPEKYNQVGKYHNQGLDHVFGAIKAKTLNNMKTEKTHLKSREPIDYNRLVYESTLNFCKNHPALKDRFAVCQGVLNKNRSRLKSAGSQNTVTKELNYHQQKYINQICHALKEDYSQDDPNRLKSRLNLINQAAARGMEEKDAAVIYCAASTAYSSYQYWRTNYKKWYFALNFPEILKKYNEQQLNRLQIQNKRFLLKSTFGEDDSWWSRTWDSAEEWWYKGWNDEEEKEWFFNALEEMGEADVYGAIGGSIAGIPGAIAGGCLTSGIEGVDQLLDKYD